MRHRKKLLPASVLAFSLIGAAGLSAGAPLSVLPDDKSLAREEMAAVQLQEDQRGKSLDKYHGKQAKQQAEYYKWLAGELKRSGGNPRPLLDAAAYFEAEAMN